MNVNGMNYMQQRIEIKSFYPREEVLSDIKDISVRYAKYKWDKQRQSLVLSGSGYYKICDGKDCFGKILWANLPFAQRQLKEMSNIEISYTFGESKKRNSVLTQLLPRVGNDYLKVGVMLDGCLDLTVFFGCDESTAVKAECIPLQLF